MKTYQIKAYQFDELSDEAKEVARNWYRSIASHDEWWDSTYEDAANIGLKISGFDLYRNRHATGEFIVNPKNCADSIIKNHGDTCESYKTAAQYIKDFEALLVKFPQDAVGDFIEYDAGNDTLDDLNGEFLKSLLEDYSIMLQEESEFLNSSESADENIRANEYEFTASGKRFVPENEPKKYVSNEISD